MITDEDAVFFHQDVKNIFTNKTVVVLGDSIQRSVYKDLVCLWYDSSSRYLTETELRAKGELSFLGDKLLLGGQLGERVNGVQYKEVREFRELNTVFRFYFITRCFNDYVQTVLNEFMTLKPDIIIINSCYWDVHHYGEQGRQEYRENLDKLFSSVSALPSHPLLLWISALPLAEQCKGGFLRQGFKTLPRNHVVWANDVARDLTTVFGFIYIDLFFTLDRNRFFTQAEDGIHWGKRAHRKISNSILAAICRRLSIRFHVGRQLNSASNLAFSERFTEHSFPNFRMPELDYYPEPLFGLDMQPNLLSLNLTPFLTPPPKPALSFIDRYLDHSFPLNVTPTTPRFNQQLNFHRSYSEPALYRNRKLPMLHHYKKRFDKINKINTLNANNAQANPKDTPLYTQSSKSSTDTTTSVCESSVNNTETESNVFTPTSNSTPKIGEVDSVSEGNKDNMENTGVTNNQDIKAEEAIACTDAPSSNDNNNNSQEAGGAKKRKREKEEEDVESCPLAKRGKSLSDTPVKCLLRFDSFL